MKAKEMFKELGFREMTGYTGLMYQKESIEHFELIGDIQKTTWVHFVDNTVEVTKNLFIGASNSEPIDMKLLKAINKQIEELHWNE